MAKKTKLVLNQDVVDRVRVTHVLSPFADRSGLRGRPQVHPQLTVDLSAVSALVEDFGEAQVRLASFARLREALGLDSDVAISEHGKLANVFVVKTKEISQNIAVEVLPV